MKEITNKFIELANYIDEQLPPVGEVAKCKERLTEALLWAQKALEEPPVYL